MDDPTSQPVQKVTPVYVAYETFRNFIESLAKTATPPDHIGKGLMPNLSGGSQSHLLLALKFLGLTKQDGAVTDDMRDLAKSFGKESWAAALAKVASKAYEPIVKGVNLASTTDEKLCKVFKDHTPLDGSVLDRAIRFYVKMLKDAKVPLSSYVGKRKPRRVGKKANGKPAPNAARRDSKKGRDEEDSENQERLPNGMIDFPIPIGTMRSFIRVPKEITTSQFPMVKAMVDAVEVLAKQNTPEKK